MHRMLKLFIVVSTLLLPMCTAYDQTGAIVSLNGLSCQNRTEYGFSGGQRAATCYYQCPDGTIRRPELAEEFNASSPLYSASKGEVDAQLCPGVTAPTATQPVPTDQPTDAPTEIPTETAAADPTATTVPATATIIVLPNLPPLLQGEVTMCDAARSMINFRLIEPVPDLAGRDLEVQIADQPVACSINPVNTSLLSCTLPSEITFPTRVLVSLDGAIVNDFMYDGQGCVRLTTPGMAPPA